MIALVQIMRRVLVTFARSFDLLWSGRELSCRDCVYHLTCRLPPDNNCVGQAGRIASRGTRPVQHGTLIDWWCGLGP
jgi:hypothetical protein